MSDGATILVIDDDPVLIKLLDSRLKENGYNLITADQAADGLQMAIDHKPDLIILDVMMPIINGYNICRLLKEEIPDSNIPIILLTARGEKEDLEIGEEVGADAYLTKPVDMGDLLAQVKSVISR